jgi:hypothetical protein
MLCMMLGSAVRITVADGLVPRVLSILSTGSDIVRYTSDARLERATSHRADYGITQGDGMGLNSFRPNISFQHPIDESKA